MSEVPEHHGLIRSALIGSLMIHLVLAFVPWGGFVEGEGEDLPGAGDLVVSLFPGLAGGEESPEETNMTVAPPEAVPEPDPMDPMELDSEPTESVADDPELPQQKAADLPASAGGAAIPGGGGGTTLGEESEGAPATGPGAPPSPYQPPRLLAGALPIDPDDSEELNVPAEIPVRLRIGADGMVQEIVPSDPDLPPKVIEALERSAQAMRFIPARRDDRPVEAWFHMTFIHRK